MNGIKNSLFVYFSVESSERDMLGGGGGYFKNFWVVMCRCYPGTLNLYQS